MLNLPSRSFYAVKFAEINYYRDKAGKGCGMGLEGVSPKPLGEKEEIINIGGGKEKNPKVPF